ncbi:DUF4189 domain-containing protein [Sphingopyxis indica]|uniref:DUF4189 domain-containing protein n=1 Tax=Sphingopyxis indica TaxID=436663 RepID=UPI0029394522|nr:DUF4189 domain-containing protein [Sphingopyxis indica]WOF42506.1 DUF4189 domain-containing protein [Sphingopyxis indica]
MKMPSLSAVFGKSCPAILLLALGWCFWPEPAAAQHVCSGRPDEVMVGVGRGGPGVAGPPLCQWVAQSGQGQAPAPARPMPNFYMAVATHRDSSDIWATWGHGSNGAAERAALKGCERAMGTGCEIAAAWSNLAEIAVARDVAGTLWVEGAAKESGNAKRLALAACREVSTGCQEAGTVTNGTNRGEYFPTAPAARRYFAIVAWPKKDPGPQWQGKVWLVSGMRGYQASEQAVLQRCKAESGAECEVGKWDAGGALVRVMDDQRQSSWLRTSDASIADQRAKVTCAKGRTCLAVELYDAQTPRALTLDLSGDSQNPIRGFFSIAWPKAKSSWNKLAIVTGRKNRAEADAAAIALCEKDSREACEPYLDNGDRGFDRFALILQDSGGNIRAHFGISPDDAQGRKRQSCAEYGVTCPEGRLIDLADRADLVVSY